MDLLFVSLIGYLIGSVPFGYVIGTRFYRTDIREHGSGNLGASNAGRVLGKKAGAAVMALDFLKVTFSVYLALRISSHPWSMACGAVAAAIGHCFPVYVRFRGGKAVAALYGFLFALWVLGGMTPWVFFLPLTVFGLVLASSKIVSLSSMLSSLVALIHLCVIGADDAVVCAVGAYFLLIVLRHSGNTRRILAGTERRITWLGTPLCRKEQS